MATHASVEGIFEASQKLGLTRATFLAYIVPPLVCLYLMGVLVQLEGTRVYRFALLPILVWFAWRGSFVDMSGGDPKQSQLNTVLISHMCVYTMRATVWAVAREPFRRQDPLTGQYKQGPESIYTACWNTWDLMIGARGIGWNWSRGLVVPKPAIETESRIVFVLLSAVKAFIYVLGFDACIQGIRMLGADTFGSLNGGTLFNPTLPLHWQLLQPVFVTFLTVWLAYFMLQWPYHLFAVIGIVVLRQRPSQWPPMFDSPWLSTSLTELWGRRWHQMMRELLVGLGMRPLSYLFGRLGGIMGAFLLSGVFHDIELRSFGRGGNSVAQVGFWVMCGIGVVLERIWKRVTGKRVGGACGWVWTFGWMALWGVWVVEAWCVSGRFGGLSLPEEISPSKALVGFVRRWIVGSY